MDTVPMTTQVEEGHTPEKGTTTNGSAAVAPRASRIPGFLQKVLNPERNSVSNLSASLDRFYHSPQEPLPADVQKKAYFNPAITSPTPTIWIVKDDMGISEREVQDTRKAVPGLHITDEQAVFTEKNKVLWKGQEEGLASQAPVYEERIVY